MASSIPGNTSLSVFTLNWLFVSIIFLQNVEKWLVTTEGYTSKLVVIPVFVQDILNIAVLVTAKANLVLVGARLTNKDT